ncbi:MAG: hypothetical protein ACI87W_002780 [Halieaceae bacterium]|jgi:hypothetical protein
MWRRHAAQLFAGTQAITRPRHEWHYRERKQPMKSCIYGHVLKGAARNVLAGAALLILLLPTARAAVEIDDSQLFVDYMYQQFLGRPGEAGGVAFWEDEVEGGRNPLEVVGSFFSASEFQEDVGPVARLYQAGLGRIPDSSGLNFWVGRYRSGDSLEQIAASFLASQEFIDNAGSDLSNAEFIDLLYQFVLGRAGEPGGVTFWNQELADGTSRGRVLVGFSESQENKEGTADRIRVTLLYAGLLGRAVTPDELAAGLGKDTPTLIDQLLEQGSSVSIAIVGLGDDILVTDQSSATVAGVADSSVALVKVIWDNSTSGTSGTAAGTDDWTAPLTLAQGDNSINFSALNLLGIAAKVGTVLTYFDELSTTTPLTLSTNVAYVNEAREVTFTLGVDAAANTVVTLLSADSSGANTNEIGGMFDNGQLPDEIEGDGIYTITRNLTAASTGDSCFRAQVADSLGAQYLSETACIFVSEHFTNDNIVNAVDTGNLVESLFEQADEATPVDEVADSIVAQIVDQPGIGTAGSTGTGSVWWVTDEGILGAYHPVLAGQKSGSRAVGELPPRPDGTPPAATSHFPAAYLYNRSAWRPGDHNPLLQPRAGSFSPLAEAMENRVRSTRAVLVSPYIANPNDPGNSFGLGDDYFVPWQFLKDQQACNLYAAKEALNNGSIGVGLNDFTDLSSFGYIHYSTHGDNYYSGLLNLWDEAWGPNDFLKGSLSQVVLFTGLKIAQNGDGSWNFAAYEDDIKAKRLIISADGSIAITPAYFDQYVGSLPNSLVTLAACRTTYNNSLANVFLKKGAGAVLGYTDYVFTSYAQNTTKKVIEEMLKDKTIQEAFDAATAAFGTNDGGANPAYFTRTGASDLKLSDGNLTNLGFEEGVLTPWEKDGDGRVISQLGATLPVEGVYMGIISTGLGFTVDAGSIEQSGCLAPTAANLNFNWNFFSEEFIEFCDSSFQDAFNVQMCEIDDGGAEQNCSTLFDTFIDALCDSVSPVDISFDQGDVYSTGWQSQNVDISPFAGKRVVLKLNSTDVGDSIYDSAITVDNIQVSD